MYNPLPANPIYPSILINNFISFSHRVREAVREQKKKTNKYERNPDETFPYNPESICSTTFSPVQAAHSRQVCATVEGSLIFWISSGYEIVLTYKPLDMCQAMWQWKARNEFVSSGAAKFRGIDRSLTPDSRVVGLDLHDHVRGGAVLLGVVQDVDVAAGRVAGVDDAAVPGAVAFCEDVHVVAVVVEAAEGESVSPGVMGGEVPRAPSRHELTGESL
jgi:hypothetical protein